MASVQHRYHAGVSRLIPECGSGSGDWPRRARVANSALVLLRGDSDPPVPLWERLLILTGAVPLAGYLALHLLTQLSVFWGPNAHARWGGVSSAPGWVALEIVGLYLPLVAHVVLGVRRLARPDEPADGTDWPSPLGRRLAQASGAVLLIFLVVHVAEFRLRSWTGELLPSDYYSELCARLSSTRWGGVPWAALGYLLGVAAAAQHGAWGLYHGALRLGLVGARRAGAWARFCLGLGWCCFGLGALIVIDLATGSVLIHLPGS